MPRIVAGIVGGPAGRENRRQMDTFTIVGAVIVVVLSITSHEAAHAWVADRLGDPTARRMGRVTLNPLPHIDPFFTVMLPGILLLSGFGIIFGGAKPVPVNIHQLRHPRRDWALVGAAGPVSNLLIGLLLCGLLAVLIEFAGFTRVSIGTKVLSIGIFVNVLLAVFNLIPIPPLDGSRVVQYFLAPRGLEAYRRIEQFGLLIILGLFFLVPPFQDLLRETIFGALRVLTGVFGVTDTVLYSLSPRRS